MDEVQSINVDFGSVCRFCLKETNSDVSVMDKLSNALLETTESIGTFVSSLTVIEIAENDVFPLQVCISCHNCILVMFDFIQLVKQADLALKDSLKTHLEAAQAQLGCDVFVVQAIKNEPDTEEEATEDTDKKVDVCVSSRKPSLAVHNVENLDKNQDEPISFNNKKLSERLKDAQTKLEEDKLRSKVLCKKSTRNTIVKCCVCGMPEAVEGTLTRLDIKTFQCSDCTLQVLKQEETVLEECLEVDSTLHKSTQQAAVNNRSVGTFNRKKKKMKKKKQTLQVEEVKELDKTTRLLVRYQCLLCECDVKFTADKIKTHFCETHDKEDGHMQKENVLVTWVQPRYAADLYELYPCTVCDTPLTFSLVTKLIKHMLLSHCRTLEDITVQELAPVHINSLDIFENGDSTTESASGAVAFRGTCKTCSPQVEFTALHEFLHHMDQVHGRKLYGRDGLDNYGPFLKQFRCVEPGCDSLFSYKNGLKKHCLVVHGKKLEGSSTTSCPEPGCFETFPSNKAMIRHGLTLHNKYFATRHLIYKTMFLSGRHADRRKRNFECDICHKRFLRKSTVREHLMNSHFPEAAGMHVCPYCGKTFTKKWLLKPHIEFIHEVVKVPCPVCHKKYNYNAVGRHYAQHVNGKAATKFLCNHCGKVLSSQVSFENHQNLHLNIRNYACDQCDGRYTSKRSLNLHKLIHEPERKTFSCEQCGKQFNGRHTLNRHLLTHTGVKDFVCEVCSKPFYTMQELNRHLRAHKKEFRYDCDYCEMRFCEKSRFRVHLMRHKNVRPHRCKFCDKLFITKRNLNLHMASRHQYHVPSQGKPTWKDPSTYISLDQLLKL